MARKEEIPNTEFNRIVAGTHFQGEINTSSDIRIDGTVTGTLKVQGKVVLGANGRIEGEIHCKNAEVMGSVNATIKVEELLSLKASAKVMGEISTNKIAIEPGAKISGNINMDKQMGHLKVAKGDEAKKEAAS